VAQAQNRLADARPLLERAQAIYEKVGGPESPNAIDTALNEAELLKGEKKYAEAEAIALHELPLAEKAFGADHVHVGMLLINLGSYESDLGKHAESLLAVQRALPIFENKLGKDHIYTTYALAGIGEQLLELHKPAEARPYLERALASGGAHDMDPADVAELEAALEKSHR
jgi:tetratricopeptide (TPR) repeat protein